MVFCSQQRLTSNALIFGPCSISSIVYQNLLDRNGYIPLASCHYPRWLNANPKSQLMRVRRNCIKKEDYNMQADILLSIFQEKGYNSKELLKRKTLVGEMRREVLFKKKEANKNDYDVAFLISFTRQHKQMEIFFFIDIGPYY